ncbi:MAG: hypothetical protein ACP5P1_15105 [Acidimicrobiales bacterium]
MVITAGITSGLTPLGDPVTTGIVDAGELAAGRVLADAMGREVVEQPAKDSPAAAAINVHSLIASLVLSRLLAAGARGSLSERSARGGLGDPLRSAGQ